MPTGLRTIFFSILVPGTVGVIVPLWIASSRGGISLPGANPLGIMGGALIALGAAIYVSCAWNFTFVGHGTPAPIDPPSTLVAQGPYRYVRNPMYVAVMAVILGEAFLMRMTVLIGYGAILFVGFHLFTVLYEEPTLCRKFGADYTAYCQAVPRWIPLWSARKPRSAGMADR
jgi:protein-S-isoprenylcysteine O-methyltransferase Ste14